MFHIIHPKKDATIYSYDPCKNTSLDEILELNTVRGPAISTSECSIDPYETSKEDVWPVNEYDMEIETLWSHNSRIILYFDISNIIEKFELFKKRFYERYDTEAEADEAWVKLTAKDDDDPLDQDENRLYNCKLRLWATESFELPFTYDIEAFPIRPHFAIHHGAQISNIEGFGDGPGREFNDPKTTIGVSWINRDNDTPWDVPGAYYHSFTLENDRVDGVNQVETEGINSFQVFNFEDPDVCMDVTDVFDYWVTQGEGGNAGLLVKRSETDEMLGEDSTLKFFGTKSHTIYVPELVVAINDQYWDAPGEEYDFEYYPGLFSDTMPDPLVEGDNLRINIYNLKPDYYADSMPRFRVSVNDRYKRNKFIEKDYVDTFTERDPNYIPTYIGTIKYSIIDKVTKKVIVPFSQFSKLSLDAEGYFFDLDLTNFFPDRFYKILFKYEEYKSHPNYEGLTQEDLEVDFSKVYDNNQTFKVIES